MLVGEKIRSERIKRGLSQEELGKLLGVTKVSVCGYETGTRTPTIDTFLKISEVLKLNPNELLGRDVFGISEEEVPYQFQMTRKEMTVIQMLRTHKELYQALCNHPEEIIEQLSTIMKKKS